MSLKIEVQKPQTQTVEAVKSLLAWRGRAADPLPQYVELGESEGKVVLVLSNKRDAYYTTTARDCSCPAAIYHRGPCKHMRRYFPEERHATKGPTTIKQPNHGAWHGHNGPVIEDGERPFAAKVAPSSPVYVDLLPDPSNRDIAYFEMAETRQYWPLEA